MSHAYRALVEATGDKMIGRGDQRVPLDSMSRADALGFAVDTFNNDVLAYVADVAAPADPRQTTFQF